MVPESFVNTAATGSFPVGKICSTLSRVASRIVIVEFAGLKAKISPRQASKPAKSAEQPLRYEKAFPWREHQLLSRYFARGRPQTLCVLSAKPPLTRDLCPVPLLPALVPSRHSGTAASMSWNFHRSEFSHPESV